MDIRRQRSFRPSLDGHRLEDRLALSGSATSVAAAAPIDPLVPTTNVTLRTATVQKAVNQLHTAFQTYISQVLKAGQNASEGLAEGKAPADLLAGFKAYEALEGGSLLVKVEHAADTFPGGDRYLFNPPMGVLPPSDPNYPPVNSNISGPDLRYYVPPPLRLKTQVETMLATLNAQTTIEQALGPNTIPLIRQTYQGVKLATSRYVNFANQNGDFTVAGLTPTV